MAPFKPADDEVGGPGVDQVGVIRCIPPCAAAHVVDAQLDVGPMVFRLQPPAQHLRRRAEFLPPPAPTAAPLGPGEVQ